MVAGGDRASKAYLPDLEGPRPKDVATRDIVELDHLGLDDHLRVVTGRWLQEGGYRKVVRKVVTGRGRGLG